MSRTFLDEALRERARLQAELEASEAYRNLQLIEEVISVYQGKGSKPSRAKRSAPIASEASEKVRRAEPSNKVQDILRFAVECINDSGGAASKRAIHEHVARQGIDVTEAALSAYLSKSFQLRFDAQRGWMLEDAKNLHAGLHRADVVPLREPEAQAKDAEKRLETLERGQALWAAEGSF